MALLWGIEYTVLINTILLHKKLPFLDYLNNIDINLENSSLLE